MAIDLTFTSPERVLARDRRRCVRAGPADPTSLRERVLLDIPSMGMMPGGEVELSSARARSSTSRTDARVVHPGRRRRGSSSTRRRSRSTRVAVGAAATAIDPAAILAALEGAISVDEVGPTRSTVPTRRITARPST
jgi:hypothetical protein